jgi:hypothetical protein
MPCARPDSTSARKRALAPSPLMSSKRSPLSRRQNMHRQPAQAPFAPKSLSMMGQSPGKSGLRLMMMMMDWSLTAISTVSRIGWACHARIRPKRLL